jgi:hypothetical protein
VIGCVKLMLSYLFSICQCAVRWAEPAEPTVTQNRCNQHRLAGDVHMSTKRNVLSHINLISELNYVSLILFYIEFYKRIVNY